MKIIKCKSYDKLYKKSWEESRSPRSDREREYQLVLNPDYHLSEIEKSINYPGFDILQYWTDEIPQEIKNPELAQLINNRFGSNIDPLKEYGSWTGNKWD